MRCLEPPGLSDHPTQLFGHLHTLMAPVLVLWSQNPAKQVDCSEKSNRISPVAANFDRELHYHVRSARQGPLRVRGRQKKSRRTLYGWAITRSIVGIPLPESLLVRRLASFEIGILRIEIPIEPLYLETPGTAGVSSLCFCTSLRPRMS